MGLFDRFRRRNRDEIKSSATRGPSTQALGELKQFLDDRQGIEGFIEPPTAVYAMTLLLVASDGEYLRRPVKHEKQARKLCDDHGVPLYEARKVGYPQRMKDYERGIKRKSVSLEDLPPLDVTDETDS
ncbi:MAG: oxidoreductase [Euzebya sp.]